jgi:hypothetical protein
VPENLTIAIVVSTCATVFGWAVWVIAVNIRRSRTSKQIVELHSRLLDRFTGNPDLIAFLEGESGRRYFEALESDLKDPLSRILNGVQAGVALILLGIALIAVRSGQVNDAARNALAILGIPGIALGTGFLLSAVISYRLCKSWGLIGKSK